MHCGTREIQDTTIDTYLINCGERWLKNWILRVSTQFYRVNNYREVNTGTRSIENLGKLTWIRTPGQLFCICVYIIYAICGTSGRIVLEGRSFYSLACFSQFLKRWSSEPSPWVEAVYTGGLRSVLVRNVLSQAVSRQPLTAEARVRSQAYPLWGWWLTEWHWDRFFLRVRLFSAVSIIPPILNTPSFIYYWRDTSLAVDGVIKQSTWRNGETERCFQPKILGTWICQKTYNALILVANFQRGRYDVFSILMRQIGNSCYFQRC